MSSLYHHAAPFGNNNTSIYNNDISGEENLDFINNCSITNHLITIKDKIINDLRNNIDIDDISDNNEDEVGPEPAPSPCKMFCPTGTPFKITAFITPLTLPM